MTRNFEGLGVGIEVDDGGSTKKLQGLGNTVDDLWQGLKKAGSLAPKLGQAFSKGLGSLGAKGGQAFGAATMAMGTMIDKAMSPDLDHAYSSMYAGFNKSFSALTAGMNISEKEMKKARKAIGGAAFGMGEDMDEAAKNWAVFRQQNLDLEKILGTKGLTGTMKGLIKVTSVYEMQGEQLAVVAGSLVKGFGFTEEAVGGLADKIVASGKVFNMGKEAIQSWPAVLESLNNELADFGKTLSPQEIENLTLSIVQLGGGLKEALGLAPQQAMEVARTMFTTIAGERKNIINMFRGMGGEFGDVAKGLMESGGDVNKMFAMMTQGDPLKFMDTLRQMSEEAKKRGGETGIAFQRLSGVMTEALGPDIAFAMKGNWDKARDSMAQIPEALRGSEGMFKNIANEHWKSSITAGEAWDRMIEGMKARMFGLSKGEVNKWKKNMKSGFEDTFNVISKLAKDDGPLGELTRKMLAVQRVGLTALIPSLSGLAPVLGGVASSAMPVMTAMGSMGLTFSSLGSMAMKGGALFGLFYLLKNGPKQAIKNIKEMGTKIWESLGEMFPELEKKVTGFFSWLKNADLEAAISGWFDNIDIVGFFDEMATGVGGVDWGTIFGQIMGAAKGLLKGVGGLIGSLLSSIDWGELIVDIVSFAGNAMSAIGGAITSLLAELFNPKDPETGEVLETSISETLFNAFIGAFNLVRKLLVGAVGGLFRGLFGGGEEGEGGGIEKFGKVAIAALTGLLIFSGKFRTQFIGGFKGMFTRIKRLSNSSWKAVCRKTRMDLKKLGKTMRRGAKMLGGVSLFMGLIKGLEQVKVRMANVSTIMQDDLVPDFAKTSLAGKEAFRGITSTIDAALMGIPGMIGDALGVSSKKFDDFYFNMSGEAESNLAYISYIFSSMVDGLGVRWNSFKDLISAGWEYIKLSATAAGKSINAIWTKVTTHLESGLDVFITTFERLFMRMGQSMELAMFSVQETIVGIIRKLPVNVPWLTKFADQFDKYKKDIGGKEGLGRKFIRDNAKFEKDERDREKARKEKRDKADTENLKAQLDVLGAVTNVKRVALKGAVAGVKAQMGNDKTLYHELGLIGETTEKNKKEAAKAEERAAKKNKKNAREEEKSAGDEGKKAKRGKGKGKGKDKGVVPTTAERVEKSNQMVVKDMFKVIEGGQIEMIKRTDALTAMAAKVGKNPIDVYVGLDGAKVQKGLDRYSRKKAAGKGFK